MAVQQVNMTFLIALPSFMQPAVMVLLINPRGSTGYGQDFCKAIYADWGNLDYQDVMAGVDYSIAQGILIRKLVGGWSYGGILTNYVITKQIDSKRRYQARAKRYLEIMVMIITNLLGRNWVALGKRSSLGAYFALQ
jgi:hypothetical protein